MRFTKHLSKTALWVMGRLMVALLLLACLLLQPILTIYAARGHSVGFNFDAANNLTRLTDAAGKQTAYSYDNQNRLQNVALHDGKNINYEWEADGLLKKVNYGDGLSRNYSYDDADRVSNITNAFGNNQSEEFAYQYDKNSNREVEIRRNNGQEYRHVEYDYDQRNQLKAAFYSGGEQGLKAEYFDSLDFTNRRAQRVDATVDFQWNEGTQPAPDVQANNFSARWSGQFEASSFGSYLFTIESDGGARVFLDGELIIDDGAKHIGGLVYEVSGSAGVLRGGKRHDLQIEYFNNSGAATIRLKYSSLTSPTVVIPAANLRPPPTQNSYVYDAVGNRRVENKRDLLGTVASYEYAYDDLNRLVSLSGNPSGVLTYIYDDNGNLKETKTAGQTANKYEYDARDQLRRVSDGNNQDIARYDYDVQQRRLAKFLPGGIEQRYVYGPDTVINEFNWQDQLTARYDVAADRLRGEIGGEGSRFYFSDALGSVTALAGVNNQAQPFVAARYEYDAWGNQLSTSGVTANAWGYKAERLDPETTLQAWDNGKQYYASGDARFIQDTNLGGMLFRPGGEGDEYRRLRRQSHSGSWLESIRGYAGRASYIAGDAISFGGRTAQDRADTDYADGYISGWQYAKRTAVNTVLSVGAVGVSVVVAAKTGGLSLAAQLGIAAGLGVTGKFLRESYEMRYEGRVEYGSLGSYLATAALSAGSVALKHGAGWALGKALGPGAGVPGGEPGAIGPGGGGLAPRGPTGIGPYTGGGGLSGSPIPASLIAQGVGTGLSQALVQSPTQALLPPAPSGNLNPIGQQGPFNLPYRQLTDFEMQSAIDTIHTAQYGYNTQNGRLNPMTITVPPNGRVIISHVSNVPPPAAIRAANEIFGEGTYEIVRGGKTTHAQTNGVKGINGHHSEARGIYSLEDVPPGTRQASTHYACEICETRQIGNDVNNITGTKRVYGVITRKKLQ